MSQANFLGEFVVEILKKNGFVNLTDSQKQVYVPQFTGLLEERIGIELVPKLSAEKMKIFVGLLDKTISAEEWKKFWYSSIPNFEEEMKKVLSAFAVQMMAALKV